MKHWNLLALGFLVLLGPDLAHPQSPPAGHEPRVCSGFNSGAKKWGMVGSDPRSDGNDCPRGHAWFAVAAGLKREFASGPDFVSISGSCCPLPADDILTDEHLTTFSSCPDGYVATGASLEKRPPICESDDFYACLHASYQTRTKLRCTRINQQRYALSAVKPGTTISLTHHLRESFEQRVARSRMPVSMRYGLGRTSQTTWVDRACVGSPPGALFVGRDDKRCSKVYFRILEFRGVAADPSPGTRVQMVPNCLAISDPLDPKADCLR